MARGRYLWDAETSKWLPAAEVLAKRRASQPVARSTVIPCPMVIGTMDDVKSPIDGRYYNSKSEYYRHVERAGCAIVGFDKNWEQQVVKPRYDENKHEADIVADVKKSIEQVNTHGGVPNE